MRKLISILICVCLFQISNGQDSTRRFELGSTLLTINSFNRIYYFAPDRPSFEFMNGLFFRYTYKRLALRLHASYAENSTSFATPSYWSDGGSGDISSKDLRIGAGVQFSLLKRKEWLYTFLDLSYRNVFSTGHYYGGYTGAYDRFSSTANGFDSFLGLGFKIKTIKHVYLSPEIGYYSSSMFVNKTTTPINSGKSSSYSYTEVNIKPVIKLHLTVNF